MSIAFQLETQTRANHLQRAPIVFRHKFIVITQEQADSCRSRIKLCDFESFDSFPIASRVWMCWRRFKQNACATIGQRTVNHICMPSDPADIGHTAEYVISIRIVFENQLKKIVSLAFLANFPPRKCLTCCVNPALSIYPACV